MIKGNIAIPDKDPKSWRSRGRKKRAQPAIASAIVTSPPMKKAGKGVPPRTNDTGHERPKRSAIVEPKRKPNSMLSHLLDHDSSDEERNRRADLADEMFREIKRRVAATKRD